MNFETKLIISGLVVGSLLLLVGRAAQSRMARRLDNLHEVCIKREVQLMKITGDEFPHLCTPGRLMIIDDSFGLQYKDAVIANIDSHEVGTLPRIHGELVLAERRLNFFRAYTLPAAFVVMLVLAIPWVWYFFLNRMRELSSALRNR